jgi:hypothetical protein
LVEGGRQGPARKGPILLELADQIPVIIAYPFEERLSGVPGVKEHKLGLAFEPVAGIAQQFQGQHVL